MESRNFEVISGPSKIDSASILPMLQDSQSQRLLRALETFSATLKFYGFEVAPYSEDSLRQLPSVSHEKRGLLATHYEQWNSWIQPQNGEIAPGKIDGNKERVFAERALSHFNLKVDEEFWKTLTSDQIIEIYGSDMIQLYRNLNFFRFCSYSLLEISINEWYNLWERPSFVMKEIFSAVEVVLGHFIPVMPYRIPRHLLREKKRISEFPELAAPRSCLVDFKYIASLRRDGNPKPAGAIVTASASLVAEGDAAFEIQFV